MIVHDSKAERFVAIGSFVVASALAFTSMMISADHDITAGVLMAIAQFLLLTATIFGLDYRVTNIISRYGPGNSGKRDTQQ